VQKRRNSIPLGVTYTQKQTYWRTYAQFKKLNRSIDVDRIELVFLHLETFITYKVIQGHRKPDDSTEDTQFLNSVLRGLYLAQFPRYSDLVVEYCDSLTPPVMFIFSFVFTARCTLVQSAVLRSHVVCLSACLSVTLVDCDHIRWNSSKIILSLVSLGCSLFAPST